MARAVLRPRRQLTLPRDICRQLGIDTGDQVDLSVEDGTLVVTPSRKRALDALAEIQSAFARSGLTKDDIRALSQERGLPTWDKPAMACLSSRIPYGTPVTVEALGRIGEAEAYLRSLGVRQLRVRHHEDVARIEADEAGLELLIARRAEVVERLKALGYLYVTLDLAGYRSGSLNAALGRRGRTEATST